MDNHTFLGAQPPENFFFGDPKDPAIQTAAELVRIQRELGLSLSIHDKNLMTVSAQFQSMSDLLSSPEFIAHLTQDFYLSDASETQWFMMRLKRGRFTSITLLLMMKIHLVRIINKCASGFDYLVVSYSPGEKEAGVFMAVIPKTDFSPSKIPKLFSGIIGENAVDLKEIGKIICFILSKHISNPAQDSLVFVGNHQGFTSVWNGKKVSGVVQFNPPRLLPSALEPYLAPALQSRQYPTCSSAENEDITPILAPLFSGSKWLLIVLLFRVASWMQFLFARRDVYADNVIELKPTPTIPIPMLIAIVKNIRYDNLDAPPVGPNIKPLRFDLETVNDGVVVVIDPFAADQVKKAEKGYDLLIQDACGTAVSSSGIHHIIALISGYADLYIPREKCCVLEPGDTETAYSPSVFKTALKRLDANLILRIEKGCNDGDLEKVFNSHVDEITAHIPGVIPISKQNTYIMLCTALRMYREFYSPLFTPDFEQEIEAWLISQEQELQPLNDLICSEYGKILNRRISEQFYHLIQKAEVTAFDKGYRAIIVDKAKRQIYIETTESFEFVKDMATISDPDRLTAALYDCGYLPHNPRAEKSKRIAAEASDGTTYPLYVHALNYTLLNEANRQRLDLIDKEPFLFQDDELPAKNFLPIIKTIDGRFAGKFLDFEAEASHHYFGSGRSGSGKSWQLGQLMPMLRMLDCNVVVLDTSSSFTEAQLRKMLPADVVERLFHFIHIGTEQDQIPVDLGSLSGCCKLPARKSVIYKILAAAVGKFDQDRSKDSQQRTALKNFLSAYLNDKRDWVDLVELTEKVRSSSILSPRISEVLNSVFHEVGEIGCEKRDWGDLFSDENRILVLDLGNEVGDSSHILLDILAASLHNWQHLHNERYLAIFIDELADQNFADHSPLATILKQGRKDHIMMLGATQDFYGQGNSCLDVLKQATIKSFARPGKAEDRIAQKIGFIDAIDAGFNRFKAGDIIMEFDAYNRETGENEPVVLRGRVVDFADTPFYDCFLQEYGNVTQPPNDDRTV